MDNMCIKPEDVENAALRIGPYIRNTPLVRCEGLDDDLGCEAYFKPECLQITGSFKCRGALNKLMSLTEEERRKGVVTASSGNHAAGTAFAGKALDIGVTVVLPEDVADNKLKGCLNYGAKVVKYGLTSSERKDKAEEIAKSGGLTSVPAYDDPLVIAGQGTIGIEILDALKDVNAVVVPVGGGGLISGVACLIKEKNPKVKIIGVETSAIPRYSASIKAGGIVEVPAGSTCADALKVTKPGVYNFAHINRYVDEIVTAEEDDIMQAFEMVLLKAKLLAEPSSCVVAAAVLSGKIKFNKSDKVVFLLSGGNADRNIIARRF